MTIPFPFGIEEGCFASDDFQLDCTSSNITVLDRNFGHYLVASVSLDDGFLAASNMVDDSNYDGPYHSEDSKENVLDGIFYFSQEAEIINWVIANLPTFCIKNAKYACISHNSYCQNVTRGRTHFGYRCKCSNGFQGNPYLQNNCTGYISLLYHIFVFSYF